MKSILLVAFGGAMGSVLRYLTGLLVSSRYSGAFPWATFAVNISGCFAIGLLYAWSLQHEAFNGMRLFLMVGLLGGFTTFSSFGLESFQLIDAGKYYTVGLYVIGSIFVGVMAVAAGYLLLARVLSA